MKEDKKVQFFTGLIYSPAADLSTVKTVLTETFGPLAEPSPVFAFDKTRYYFDEMGDGLIRQFVAFKELFYPDELVRFKTVSREIENECFTLKSKRIVNLDPGYLDDVKLILASFKRGGHKIALTREVYADLVLDYYQGKWRSFEWTFPDFKSGEYDSYFTQLRKDYLGKLKS